MNKITTDKESPPLDLVIEYIKQYGNETISFQQTIPNASYWMSTNNTAIVSYISINNFFITIGSPLCDKEIIPKVVEDFSKFAFRAGKQIMFFCIEKEFIESLQADKIFTEIQFCKIGIQSVFDPRTWTLHTTKRKRLRTQVNRLINHGVKVEEIHYNDIINNNTSHCIKKLILHWQKNQHISQLSFLVGLHIFENMKYRRYIVVIHNEKIEALAVLIPVYKKNGWFAEHIIRDPLAPNGVVELLLSEVINILKKEDCYFFSTGLTALAKLEEEKANADFAIWKKNTIWLDYIFSIFYNYGEALYPFKGLWKFRKKFYPEKSEYVYWGVMAPSFKFAHLFALIFSFIPKQKSKFVINSTIALIRYIIRYIFVKIFFMMKGYNKK